MYLVYAVPYISLYISGHELHFLLSHQINSFKVCFLILSTKLGVFIDSLWACFVVVLNYSFELKSKLAYIYFHKLTPLLD